MTEFRHYNWWNNEASPSFPASLVKALHNNKNLTSLNLVFGRYIEDSLLDALADFLPKVKLETAILTLLCTCRQEEKFGKMLSNLSSVKNLDFSPHFTNPEDSNIGGELAMKSFHGENLINLTVQAYANISSAGWVELFKRVPSKLKNLTIYPQTNDFNNDALKALSEAIEKMNCLKFFKFYTRFPTFTADHVELFSESLGKLSGLETLFIEFSNNGNLKTGDCGVLGKGISSQKNLKILEVRFSEYVLCDSASMEQIIIGASECKELTSLKLSGGLGFSDQLIAALTKSLSQWKTLETLEIDCQDPGVTETFCVELVKEMKNLEKITNFEVRFYTYSDKLCLTEDSFKKLQDSVNEKKGLAKGTFSGLIVEYDNGH